MNQEKTVNKDQVKGRVKQTKGNAKQISGRMVGNDTLEIKGKAEKLAGKVQADYGDIKKRLKTRT